VGKESKKSRKRVQLKDPSIMHDHESM
jgi:hypothetical protein